jgi:hypothetical protein
MAAQPGGRPNCSGIGAVSVQSLRIAPTSSGASSGNRKILLTTCRCSPRGCAGSPEQCRAAALTALPLIEAVRQAGGAITLQGDRLRLSAPKPLPEDLLQDLRAHKTEVIDHLQHAGRSALAQAGAAALENRSAPPIEVVADWVAGVSRLSAMLAPRTYPERAWQQLLVDAERFLDGWAAQAYRLGWPVWELFGCHKRAPWGRIQGMGLVLLLRGDEMAALTASEVVIRTPTGAHQTYRRKLADPLQPAERCLVWELGDVR